MATGITNKGDCSPIVLLCSSVLENLLTTKPDAVQFAIFGVIGDLDRSLAIILRFTTEKVKVGIGSNVEQFLVLECAESGVIIENERSVFVGDEGGDLMHDGLSGDVVGHVSIIRWMIGYGNNFLIHLTN